MATEETSIARLTFICKVFPSLLQGFSQSGSHTGVGGAILVFLLLWHLKEKTRQLADRADGQTNREDGRLGQAANR